MISKLVILFVFVGTTVFAQNSVQISPSTSSTMVTISAKYVKGKSYSYSKYVHPYDDYFDAKIKEYEERMVANAKRYKKSARLMKKPQFSDPSYFGHKRKPKKRAPGKRKFCKECEIVH